MVSDDGPDFTDSPETKIGLSHFCLALGWAWTWLGLGLGLVTHWDVVRKCIYEFPTLWLQCGAHLEFIII